MYFESFFVFLIVQNFLNAFVYHFINLGSKTSAKINFINSFQIVLIIMPKGNLNEKFLTRVISCHSIDINASV
jgi:hypothetical protein